MTMRWPLLFFFNKIEAEINNAFILMQKMDDMKKIRSSFYMSLAVFQILDSLPNGEKYGKKICAHVMVHMEKLFVCSTEKL